MDKMGMMPLCFTFEVVLTLQISRPKVDLKLSWIGLFCLTLFQAESKIGVGVGWFGFLNYIELKLISALDEVEFKLRLSLKQKNEDDLRNVDNWKFVDKKITLTLQHFSL